MTLEPPVLVEDNGPVRVVALNRPAALNAVNSALAAGLGQALSDAAEDPDIRVVVLTGSGRAFCSGADLKEIAAGRSLAAPGHPEWGFAGVVQHWIPKPLIAAVNGLALGGGAEIVLACDLAVADRAATIGLPEVTRGLVAAGGGVLRLHRQIPVKIALEAALTGDPITAESAARWGLVNHVTSPGSALDVAVHLARRIARNAPLAVQATKRLTHRGHRNGDGWDPESWERNDAELGLLLDTEDAAEGARAFVENREPRWLGR